MANPTGLCKCGCDQRTTLARWSHTGNGYVRGQPKDWVIGHNARKFHDGYAVRDCGFETPCWIWTGRVDLKTGYGWTRRTGVDAQAHRVIYQETYGPLPPGHVVQLHHRCERPPCVNPEHLEPLTPSQHRLAHSPMTTEMAALIRASDKTQAALARELGISTGLIYLIRNNRSWI